MKSIVSIILPVFNTEEFIEDSLTSILKQSYENLEIIIIDNGSYDSSPKILDKLKERDERVKLYRLENNQGPGYARNLGVQKATGYYLYFMDSDDYLPRETIKILMNNIGDYPLIFGSHRNVKSDKAITIVYPGEVSPKLYKKNRFQLLKSRSILNHLIKREYVLQHNIKFSEEYYLFNDVPFKISAVLEAEVVPYIKEAVYFKRIRNDSVLNPSLRQCSRKKYALSFFSMYRDNKNKFKHVKIQKELDKQLIHFYGKSVVKYFNDLVDIEDLFADLSKEMSRVDKKLFKNHGFFARRELKAIFNEDEKKYRRIHSQHEFLKDLKNGLKTKRKRLRFLNKHIFRRLPQKDNLVFFESFLGRSYSDNPKYIYEYLDKHYPEYKTVWSTRKKTNIPGNAKQVQRYSLGYFYTLARAKYWITNSQLPLYFKKREQGVYLQTWHGTPLKRIGFDVNDKKSSSDPKYKENFYRQSRRWDYMNAANEFSAKIFRRTFLFENTMLKLGYPRNDILYNKNNSEDIMKLKKKFNLPTNKKIILYAPTWRDDGHVAKGKYNFSLELDLKAMQEKLGSEYIVILRMHYLISEKIDLSDINEFAFNLSDHPDIGELYLISDILITDYSSVFFDYANLKRPILFYTYDLEKYRDELRGFYLDMEKDLPGPILQTTEKVIDEIINIEQLQLDYADKYADFYERFCKWDDGKASENTVKEIFLKD